MLGPLLFAGLKWNAAAHPLRLSRPEPAESEIPSAFFHALQSSAFALPKP
jgi:hypothetical protein